MPLRATPLTFRLCKAVALFSAILLSIGFVDTNLSEAQEIDQAKNLFRSGKFSETIKLADAVNKATAFLDEDWTAIKCKSQLAIGAYADAKTAIEKGLSKFPYSVRLRWLGAKVYSFNGDTKRATQLRAELSELWKRNSWRYRDVESMMVIGRHLIDQGTDPKTVLDELYNKAKDRFPARPEIYLAIADLALDKNDYQLAAKNIAKAIELDPDNPAAHIRLTHAFRPSNSEKATESLNAALKINPNHVDALLISIEQQISAEDYSAAKENIEKVHAVNPHHPNAWAFLAALAHLDNQPKLEGEYRSKALEFWPANPHVDHLIGQQLSKKYRFEESSTYQRRALVIDDQYMPAKIQLAHDLLRLGQELEGWKLAEEIFDADQYNVVANNLVALRDNLSEFATIEKNGFIVRMSKDEADVYSNLVLQLLDEAEEKLCKKYGAELQKPIFIEIFPRQQDFAIRTFGLPGGAGFLGVCFGRVVTMNSPAAQGSSLTNWRSVLWHEFCHVVTLQKTKNKMPRWLSEGISVYEEGLANPAWGDDITADYREMILGEDLTPVSKLSSAFLNPKSAKHLQFAYFESSLVVKYLVEEYGEEKLVNVLQELSIGTPINAALTRHVAPADFLDKKFQQYIQKLAKEFAPEADWTKPEAPISAEAGWQQWLTDHPNNIYGLLGLANAQIKAKQFTDSLKTLDQFDSIHPQSKGAEQAFLLRAAAYRKLERFADETNALETVFKLDADDLPASSRLLEIYTKANDWENVKRISRRLQGINPMLKSSHRALATAAEKLSDDSLAIESLSVLSRMNPFDRADTYFRLASAQFREEQFSDAKKNVLLALETAPRYRDAHQLLLKIVEKTKPDSSISTAVDPVESSENNQ